MRRADEGLGDWIDVVAGLLQQPLLAYPVEVLATALKDYYEATCIGWPFRNEQGRADALTFPAGLMPPPPPAGEDWTARAGYLLHPVKRWFRVSGDFTAQSAAKVPESVVSRRYQVQWKEASGPFAMDQLILHLDMSDPPYRVFVIGRKEENFSAQDIAMARRLQPLLLGLDRQVRALNGVEQWQFDIAGITGLTPRELAVLRLMAGGSTAVAIGHRLGISPRTVHKHQEHAYAKLGVRDRLTAVLVATRLGLLPADPRTRPENYA